MSRSPYDPSPEYRTCSICEQQYDASGYYGSDPHICEGEAKQRFRRIIEVHGFKQALRQLLEVAAELDAEQANAVRRREAATRAYKQRQLDDARATTLRLEAELAEPTTEST